MMMLGKRDDDEILGSYGSKQDDDVMITGGKGDDNVRGMR